MNSSCLAALTIAAEGGKADPAMPMHGIGPGVFEIALPFKGDAIRVVYTVRLSDEIWDLIKDRLKRLKEMLR